MLKCWCKKCGRRLKTEREYIKQQDTCDMCFIIIQKEAKPKITQEDYVKQKSD